MAFTYSASGDVQHMPTGSKPLKRSSPDRLHANSPGVRDRSSPVSAGATLRRGNDGLTDAVTTSSYLRGEWPRSDPLVNQAYFCPSNLTVDKASQTPDEWCSVQSLDRKKSSRRSASVGSADSIKDFKARLAKTSKDATSGSGRSGQSQRRSPVLVIHADFIGSGSGSSSSQAVPSIKQIPFQLSTIGSAQKTSSHSSLESLNQEIEGLVLNGSPLSDGFVKSPSDGRRAPVAREFKSHSSALTQTPPMIQIHDDPTSSSSVSQAGGGGADGELLSVRHQAGTDVTAADLTVDLQLLTLKATRSAALTPNSASSSGTDYGSREDISKVSSSPQLASFFPERLPPDGCEKIAGKFFENHGPGLTIESSLKPLLPKPVVASFHIPSEKSAFITPSSRVRRDTAPVAVTTPALMTSSASAPLLSKYTAAVGNGCSATREFC